MHVVRTTMTYIIDGSPEQAMSAFFEHLQLAQAEGPQAESESRSAMVSLVRVLDRQATVGSVSSAQLHQFRLRSGDALAKSNIVPAYVLRTLFLAEGANDNQWYELSMRRSAIQSLLDDYSDTAVGALVDPEHVGQLDDELRRLGQADEQGPIDECHIPKGLPASHWWWRYPNQFK
jgi:hypothetical protein